VRVYLAGTRQLLGTRLVDTGSGYNAQNAMPVQFGLSDRRLVDVEVIAPLGGSRRAAIIRNVDARAWARCAIVIRITPDGARVDGAGCR
jgi:hypothetical protein